MSDVLQQSLSSSTTIFTDEIITKMEKRIYWALISTMLGLTLGLILNINPYLMFVIILCIGFLNPDDRIKGRFT